MEKLTGYRRFDLVAIAVANLFNLVMVPVFILRTKGVSHPQIIGLVWVVFMLLLAAVVVVNIRAKRAWWAIVFPLLFAVFLAFELALDYVARIEFRNTLLLWPYLLLFYAAILGMIGYSFAAGRKLGFTTLVTYFLCQFAALYSYLLVGHG